MVVFQLRASWNTCEWACQLEHLQVALGRIEVEGLVLAEVVGFGIVPLVCFVIVVVETVIVERGFAVVACDPHDLEKETFQLVLVLGERLVMQFGIEVIEQWAVVRVAGIVELVVGLGIEVVVGKLGVVRVGFDMKSTCDLPGLLVGQVGIVVVLVGTAAEGIVEQLAGIVVDIVLLV